MEDLYATIAQRNAAAIKIAAREEEADAYEARNREQPSLRLVAPAPEPSQH